MADTQPDAAASMAKNSDIVCKAADTVLAGLKADFDHQKIIQAIEKYSMFQKKMENMAARYPATMASYVKRLADTVNALRTLDSERHNTQDQRPARSLHRVDEPPTATQGSDLNQQDDPSDFMPNQKGSHVAWSKQHWAVTLNRVKYDLCAGHRTSEMELARGIGKCGPQHVTMVKFTDQESQLGMDRPLEYCGTLKAIQPKTQTDKTTHCVPRDAQSSCVFLVKASACKPAGVARTTPTTNRQHKEWLEAPKVVSFRSFVQAQRRLAEAATKDRGRAKRKGEPNGARNGKGGRPQVAQRPRLGHAGNVEQATGAEPQGVCNACKQPGLLLLCDTEGCTAMFHGACLGLPASFAGAWHCPKCTHSRNNTVTQSNVPPPPSQDLSQLQGQLDDLRGIVRNLAETTAAQVATASIDNTQEATSEPTGQINEGTTASTPAHVNGAGNGGNSLFQQLMGEVRHHIDTSISNAVQEQFHTHAMPQYSPQCHSNHNVMPLANYRPMPRNQHIQVLSAPRPPTHAMLNPGMQPLPPYDVNAAFYAGVAWGQGRLSNPRQSNNVNDLSLTWMNGFDFDHH